MKSHETMAISSHGKYIAFSGKGGNIHIVSHINCRPCCFLSRCTIDAQVDGKNKMHAMDVKMNTACRTVSFLPSHHTGEDHLMLSSGLDADVYLWDLRHTGRCLSRYGVHRSCVMVVNIVQVLQVFNEVIKLYR